VSGLRVRSSSFVFFISPSVFSTPFSPCLLGFFFFGWSFSYPRCGRRHLGYMLPPGTSPLPCLDALSFTPFSPLFSDPQNGPEEMPHKPTTVVRNMSPVPPPPLPGQTGGFVFSLLIFSWIGLPADPFRKGIRLWKSIGVIRLEYLGCLMLSKSLCRKKFRPFSFFQSQMFPLYISSFS